MNQELYLILNAGSSSIKFQVFSVENGDYKVLCRGLAERIGIDNAALKIEWNGNVKKLEKQNFPTHNEPIAVILQELLANKIIKDMSSLKGIGHRVVHGGQFFSEPTIVTPEVISKLESIIDLAPLHTPGSLAVIKAIEAQVSLPSVLVFDTSFHKTMAPEQFLYSIPTEWYEKHAVRKYGFHGTSYQFITKKLQYEMSNGKPVNAVICHLGNGSSVAAIKNSKSIDTTMGFTPMAGLTMGTRCGEIDPSIHKYIANKTKLSLSEIDSKLNKESGLLALSGVNSDMREIGDAAVAGNKKAELAMNIYSQKVANYIVSFANLVGKIDYLVFSAGIGENDVAIVDKILTKLPLLKLKLKSNWSEFPKHKAAGYFLLTEKSSSITALIINTNEELMICQLLKQKIEE